MRKLMKSKGSLLLSLLMAVMYGCELVETHPLGTKHEHVEKQPDGKCYKSECKWTQNGMHKYWKTEKISPVECPVTTTGTETK